MGEGIQYSQAALGVLPQQVANNAFGEPWAGAQEAGYCHIIRLLILGDGVEHLAIALHMMPGAPSGTDASAAGKCSLPLPR